jgi:hypothetical protein
MISARNNGFMEGMPGLKFCLPRGLRDDLHFGSRCATAAGGSRQFLLVSRYSAAAEEDAMTKAIHFWPLMLLGMHHTATAVQISARAAETGVVVRFFNIAHIPVATVADMKQEATRVFIQAGVGVTWEDGDIEADEVWSVDFSARPCSEFLRSTVVFLRVLPAAPKSFPPAAMGMALPCSAYGPQATIFWDRVEQTAHAVPASVGKILGYAVAHEIGHVLLRSSDHPQVGVMRGMWGDREWNGIIGSELAFTSAEADRMSQVVRTTRRRSERH